MQSLIPQPKPPEKVEYVPVQSGGTPALTKVSPIRGNQKDINDRGSLWATGSVVGYRHRDGFEGASNREERRVIEGLGSIRQEYTSPEVTGFHDVRAEAGLEGIRPTYQYTNSKGRTRISNEGPSWVGLIKTEKPVRVVKPQFF